MLPCGLILEIFDTYPFEIIINKENVEKKSSFSQIKRQHLFISLVKIDPGINSNACEMALIAALTTSRVVNLFESPSNQLYSCIGWEGDNDVTCINFSLDGCLLGLGTFTKGFIIWDANSKSVRSFAPTSSTIRFLDFNSDASRLLAIAAGEVQIWNLKGTEVELLQTFPTLSHLGEFGRNDATKIFVISGQMIEIWKLGQTNTPVLAHKLLGRGFAQHPIYDQFATGVGTSFLFIIDNNTYERLDILPTPSGCLISCLNYSYGGDKLAVGFAQSATLIYDTQSRYVTHTLHHLFGIASVCFNPVGDSIAVDVGSKCIQLCDLVDGHIVLQLDSVLIVRFQPSSIVLM